MEHVVGIDQGGQGQDPWERKGVARLVLDSVRKVIRTQEFQSRPNRNGDSNAIGATSLCWAVVYVPRRPWCGRCGSGCSGPQIRDIGWLDPAFLGFRMLQALAVKPWIRCNETFLTRNAAVRGLGAVTVMAIRIKARGGESAEQMLRRFKKLCEKEGLTKDVKKRQYFEKPSERNRREARKRVARVARVDMPIR